MGAFAAERTQRRQQDGRGEGRRKERACWIRVINYPIGNTRGVKGQGGENEACLRGGGAVDGAGAVFTWLGAFLTGPRCCFPLPELTFPAPRRKRQHEGRKTLHISPPSLFTNLGQLLPAGREADQSRASTHLFLLPCFLLPVLFVGLNVVYAISPPVW